MYIEYVLNQRLETLKMIIAALLTACNHEKEWDEVVDEAIIQYMRTTHSTLNTSPLEAWNRCCPSIITDDPSIHIRMQGNALLFQHS
ncbi:hypothetical protein OFB63_30675, partial [Escherichia coli]|nr:hypothetical protein [Escherichia coli]